LGCRSLLASSTLVDDVGSCSVDVVSQMVGWMDGFSSSISSCTRGDGMVRGAEVQAFLADLKPPHFFLWWLYNSRGGF